MRISAYLRNLLHLPEKYSEEDFRSRERYRSDYQILARCLLRELPFESVLDVGCANGFLLEALLGAGKTVHGLEVSPAVVAVLPPALAGRVQVGDFREASGTYDLVCCVEVAEHIPRRRSAELVDRLIHVASDWIFFTAAPPGQGGHGHLNCRPRSDWVEIFERQGWREAVATTAAMKQCLRQLELAHWLGSNAIVFRPGH